MRYLIFSDVHANIFGLQKLLEQREALKADAVFSLGDVVGYNSFPHECLQLMKEHNIPSLTGNHEAMVLGTLSLNSCKSERGQNAVRITRELITSEDKEILRGWPVQWEFNETTIAWHAGFDSLFRTVNTVQRAVPQFRQMEKLGRDLCFFGHTHRPGVFIRDKASGAIEYNTDPGRVMIDAGRRYLVNPGTLGEPRHGLPMSFVVFDAREMSLEYKTVALSAEEWRHLKKKNREVFGITSFKRLPQQLKEKGRRWYYRLGSLKEGPGASPAENKQTGFSEK